MFDITVKITEQVKEEHDRFIFETIYPYCQEHTKMVISKKILCRALEWYKKEHLDEYTELAKEVSDEPTCHGQGNRETC